LPHWFYILFLFTLGACVGSFLNVVVYRLPRGESLVYPGSRCPKCEHALAWYDNLPVLGWILLAGKCRYCKQPISARYPIIEATTGVLFAGFYIAVYLFHQGPFWPISDADPLRMQDLATDWPMFGLYLFAIASLLAISLIDAELFLIPGQIPLLLAGLALLVHTIIDRPGVPGSLSSGPAPTALAAGASIGLLISIILLRLRIFPLSFAQGGPALEVDKKNHKPGDEEFPEFTPAQIRTEIRKEMLFLIPPLALGALMVLIQMPGAPLHDPWAEISRIDWVNGLLSSLLGGLVGGGIVWLARIFFSYLFGREAMGLGDIDLMFAIGAVLGPGPAIVTFFLGPFFALPLHGILWLFKSRRELPYGPYLSIAAVFVMLFYFPIYNHFGPGLTELGMMLRSLI
jgi:leader peptidase (prepilin peptidase)/N-methyltransferase